MPELPSSFRERMTLRLKDESLDFFIALQTEPIHSVLRNPDKIQSPSIRATSPVPWNENGFYLDVRPDFVKDPLYHAGAYYSQEASSMVIGNIMEQLELKEHLFCLDLCAAPGGKSLNLLNSLDPSSYLISNEVIKSRVSMLEENISKWGNINVSITSSPTEQFGALGPVFDLILVDAPCSGEGLFRKTPSAMEQWSEDQVQFCSSRQKKILAEVIPALKSGGHLIYSTCTYSEEENGGIAEFLDEQGLESIPLTAPLGFEQAMTGNGLQAFPHKVKGEGFFVVAYRKQTNEEGHAAHPLGRAHFDKPLFLDQLPEGYQVEKIGEEACLIPQQYSGLLEYMTMHIRFSRYGIPLYLEKGPHQIPAPASALMKVSFDTPFIELDMDDAIRYLRRETFNIDNVKDGWYTARYLQENLGWIKIAAGRMKNHYPKNWRIRKLW